ncbi:hypothetical protein [Patulibacter defluvii]|uniref:hypothetical protein n=1 Tax=Patulibacter defluvii TaxID=3095358 RepID=UPI002A75CBE0|nr:hypothetical protein [Patulibacter sp. DM4]
MARRTLALTGTALALAVAGCGGGGDPSQFARATDRTCRDVAAAVTTLRQDLVRRSGRSETTALRGAIDGYAGRVERAAEGLSKADPPEDERGFRDGAVKQLREHAKLMREAAAGAAKDRVPTTLAEQLQRTGPAAMPKIPQAVLDDAPACRAAVR